MSDDIEQLAQEARQRIVDGLIDEWGRERDEGPRKVLTLAQSAAYEAHANDEQWRAYWYRRRVRGDIAGPLERHHNAWLYLQGEETGGWPSGAVAAGAGSECRNAGLDAVIESAGG